METTEKTIRPIKTEISFEDFEKLDIRICEVLEIERVPKTDKLYKMKINTGIDERIVVSSIADIFSVDKLHGRRMPFVLNLAPRKIKGIESQAMILLSSGKEVIAAINGHETGAIII